jgi:phosphatidylserine/phosphatidylglycerophosphate/cardiolipin synthase-like enzyme
MMNTIEACMRSGITVTVVTRPAIDYAEKDHSRVSEIIKHLSDKGIAVIEKPKIHQKFAVVDGRIVWYGSINLLSFGSAEESIMRLDSVGIAGELMNVMR